MSIRIFRNFLDPLPDGHVDASRVLSRECYLAFLEAKSAQEDEKQAKRFYRVLTTHVSGVDGRRPFKKHEEEAILLVLRKNEPWPCFPPEIQLGMGFRGRGHHEKLALEREERTLHKRVKTMAQSATAAAATATSAASLAAPSPPSSPPSDSTLEDEQFVRDLTTQAVHFCRSFAMFGIDVWKSVIGVIRFAVLARSCTISAPITTEYAVKICNELTARRGSEEAIMIIDFTGGEKMGRRVAAQNERCTEYFGNMTNLEGPGHLCICQEELFKVISTIASSFDQPGKEFPISQEVKNTAGDVRRYVANYLVDPQTHLLIISAKPLL